MIDLAALGYHRSDGGPWYRPEVETDFGYNDGDDAENHVRRTVREADDVSALSPELRSGIRDWPSLYHLSPRRGNVVAPFLGHLTGPVLEIGAGMGAVTRALGETGLEVLAVEGSPRRAAVCADRCRDLPNVQVVADTVQGFGQPRRFGTVVVIGVLEYARVFGFETDRDPVDVMLEHVAGLLEPGGQLILAIENQLGLKYLAGFPEDHTGRRMDGVEDRYGPDTVVTFGREELARRLTAAGLPEQEWSYPFPDYKLPRLVLAEATAQPDGAVDPVPLLTGVAAADHQHPGGTAFDADRVWDVVHRNGLLPDLANSFIVRASAGSLTPVRELAWHFGGDARRAEFVTRTVFEPAPDGVVVRRHALAPERAVPGLDLALADEPYRRDRPWSGELVTITRTAGWDVADVAAWFEVWLERFRLAMVPDLARDRLAAATPVPANALDAVPRNLLAGSGTFIDLEWVPEAPLDLGYVAFRALWDSLAQLGPVAEPAAGTTLVIADLIAATLAAAGLPTTSAELERHWDREQTFQETVNGRRPAGSALTTHSLRIERRLDDVLALAETAGPEIDRLRALETALRTEIDARGAELDRLRAVEATFASEQHRVRDLEATFADEQHRFHTVEADLAARLDHLHQVNTALGATLATLSTTVERTTAETDRLESEAEIATRALAEANAATAAAEAQAAALTARYSPYRRARSLAGRARRRIRRTLRRVPPPSPSFEEPCPELDLRYYRVTNPDLDVFDDAGLRRHYLAHGRHEGRRPASPLADATVHGVTEPERPVVLLLLHEATRTGAPVLGWNLARELERSHHVVVVLLHGGELVDNLADAASTVVVLERADLLRAVDREQVARELAHRYRPEFAVANSTATAPLAPALERAGVPVVALVHEFASSMRPAGVLSEFLDTVSEIVFPAPIVVDSMKDEYMTMLGRNVHVLPQGRSAVPPGNGRRTLARTTPRGPDGVEADLPERDSLAFLGELDPRAVLVLGAGTISPRKGVEFFAQAAARVAAAAPDLPVVFAWIGHRIGPLQWYVDELHEQVRRSGTGDRLVFLAPTAELDLLYHRADLFFLSSRLDPLPNVTIDAALAGIPTVAFAGASGFAEWMGQTPALTRLVVPHLDAAAAADVLLRLAQDNAERSRLSRETAAAAAASFDMTAYADRITTLGATARRASTQERTDVADIAASGRFDAELYGGLDVSDPSALLEEYVHRSRITAPRARPRTGLVVRRPAPGFHPLSYAEHAPDYQEERDGDPFADFLRRGEPAGPWLVPVIRPADGTMPDDAASATPPTTLVHGHFHYPDLLPDLLAALAGNAGPFALHLTATSEATAEVLTATLAEHAVPDAVVEVVPNLGRDLGPLLTALGRDVLDRHELVLHVHGKKSVHAGTDVADRWRTFLWENLVGGRHPMADRIRRAFAEDPTLGLVFPDDPHLNDWDLNRAEGERLAERLGLTAPLPQHFDFPMGGMFWARTAALRPLLDLGLDWADYPEEPLPIDGTLLHAMERMLPFVAGHAGFTLAKTAVPGVTR